MLRCHACTLRYLRVFLHDVPPVSLTQSRRLTTTSPHRPNDDEPQFLTRKEASSYVKSIKQKEYKALRRSPSSGQDAERNGVRGGGREDRKGDFLRGQKSRPGAQPVVDEDMSPRSVANYHRMLDGTLEDPYHLAEWVKKALEEGRDKDKVLELVRVASSRKIQCVVSWNHIFKDMLSRNAPTKAFKAYIEMKKRGIKPDSFTFLILLNGLSENQDNPQALERALSLYTAMDAPNSPVKPTIAHTNAIIKVCARSNNMDALWGIAGRIPLKGPGAPNSITYTTIFNSLRRSALIDHTGDATDEDIAKIRDQNIVQGRRIWEDIIGRWRKAEFRVDDDLVCAMGRLLLVGVRPRDWSDVLSLVEQTTNIKRLVPAVGTEEWDQAGLQRIRAPTIPAEYKQEDEFDHQWANDSSTRRGDEFMPLKHRDTLQYVNPSQNTLSVILEACQKLFVSKAAIQYFGYFTSAKDGLNIQPDLDNFNHYLRILRQSRASSAAVTIITKDMPAAGIPLAHGTLRIAMSTCARDKLNPNALTHARQLLDLMTTKWTDTDATTMRMYIQVVSAAADQHYDARNADQEETLLYDEIMRLAPITTNLKGMVNFGKRNGQPVSQDEFERAKDAFTSFLGICNRYLRLVEDQGQKQRQHGSTTTTTTTDMAGTVTTGPSSALSSQRRKDVMGIRHQTDAFISRGSYKMFRMRENEAGEKGAAGAEKKKKMMMMMTGGGGGGGNGEPSGEQFGEQFGERTSERERERERPRSRSRERREEGVKRDYYQRPYQRTREGTPPYTSSTRGASSSSPSPSSSYSSSSPSYSSSYARMS